MKIRRCKNEKIFIVVNFVWLSCDKIPPRLPSFSCIDWLWYSGTCFLTISIKWWWLKLNNNHSTVHGRRKAWSILFIMASSRFIKFHKIMTNDLQNNSSLSLTSLWGKFATWKILLIDAHNMWIRIVTNRLNFNGSNNYIWMSNTLLMMLQEIIEISTKLIIHTHTHTYRKGTIFTFIYHTHALLSKINFKLQKNEWYNFLKKNINLIILCANC